MKRILTAALLTAMFIFVSAGCGAGPAGNDEAKPLTEEELGYFNSAEFFNMDYADNVIDPINIRNQFLSSLYDRPQDIDLFELFYCGSGLDESMTDEELLAAAAASEIDGGIDDFQCPCEKISTENMDAVLTEHMGLTLGETSGVGLDNFVYLEEFDAYYFFHGDTNYRAQITFSSGERQGDTIRLSYDDTFFCDGRKVLTLREKEDGAYLFVSNQKAEKPQGEKDAETLAGYITFDGDRLYIDEVEIIEREDAQRIEELGLSIQNDLPSGYHIYNEKEETAAFSLTDQTTFTFTDHALLFVEDADGDRLYTTNSLEEFLRGSSYSEKSADRIPYFVETKNGEIINITESFIYTI